MPEFYTGKVGIERHPNLLDRDLPQQHPIEAITGLSERIQELDNQDSALDTKIDQTKTDLDIAIEQTKDDLAAHEARTDNPHNVSKDQIGLGNVDNTSDVDKPISTAAQEALNKKLNRSLNNINAAGEQKIKEIVSPDITNALNEAKDYTDQVGATVSDEAKDYTDQQIAISQLATQKWLSAVNTKADLPSPPDNINTYLCRVLTGADNGVWQFIPNASDWTYFGDNTDFIDQDELNTFTTHNTSVITADNSKFSNSIPLTLAAFFTAVVSKINALFNAISAQAGDFSTLLDGKVDKEAGKGLSSNDYTAAEKNKLAGIAAGAQVNLIESIKVDGSVLPIVNKQVDLDDIKRKLVRNESATTITLATAVKNTTYRYGTLSALTIGAFEDSNEEIIIQFHSGATPTVLSLPSMPIINPIPTILPNNWYEFSVLNGILAISQGVSI
jgi:hypothetical protein